MRTLVLISIFLTYLSSDQNVSTALGAQKDAQHPIKTFKQKDGSSFLGKSSGEACFKYIELENGYTVLYNKKSKQYEYAHIRNGELRPSGIAVQSGKTPENITKIPEQTLKKLEADAYKKHF
jgi:hypothetical protein